MNDLTDYVRWVAYSMGATLNDEEIRKLTRWVIKNDNYSKFLADLSDKIASMKLKKRPVNKSMKIIYIDDLRKK